MTIQNKLKREQDLKYKDFQAKLNPVIDPKTIIGVRLPVLRAIAKELKGTKEAEKFLRTLPHKYYDENMLHAIMLCDVKDFDDAMELTEMFLPYVDNWATCDSTRPKVFNKHKDEVLKKLKGWIKTKQTYTIRFGIDTLMSLYLDDDFKPEYHKLVLCVKYREYYVDMMVAWYFATALAKQWDDTIGIIESKKLDPWIHNKTIQKAIESFRITDEQKEYLRALKVSK